jgi:hypothetical protein
MSGLDFGPNRRLTRDASKRTCWRHMYHYYEYNREAKPVNRSGNIQLLELIARDRRQRFLDEYTGGLDATNIVC